MSTDQIAFILENCYAAKYAYIPHGIVIRFQLHEGNDWEQIEVELSIWWMLDKKYREIIDRWPMESESVE
jgi:hypothetical protein